MKSSTRRCFTSDRVQLTVSEVPHKELLSSCDLSPRQLASLTNAELRDDLQVKNLRQRREILAYVRPARSVPEFGRILVHLSNDRTCHSWFSNTIQALIFAGALLRIPPLRPVAMVWPCALGVVCSASAGATYGVWQYFVVARDVDTRCEYKPDWIGAMLAFVITLSIASIVVTFVLVEGFDFQADFTE